MISLSCEFRGHDRDVTDVATPKKTKMVYIRSENVSFKNAEYVELELVKPLAKNLLSNTH